MSAWDKLVAAEEQAQAVMTPEQATLRRARAGWSPEDRARAIARGEAWCPRDGAVDWTADGLCPVCESCINDGGAAEAKT